jgi:hypothetical protein
MFSTTPHVRGGCAATPSPLLKVAKGGPQNHLYIFLISFLYIYKNSFSTSKKINMCFLKINMFIFCLFENTTIFKKFVKQFLFNKPHRKYFSNVDPTKNTSQLFVISKTFSKHLTFIATNIKQQSSRRKH